MYLVFMVQLRELSNHLKKSLLCQESKSLKPLPCKVRESMIRGKAANPCPIGDTALIWVGQEKHLPLRASYPLRIETPDG